MFFLSEDTIKRRVKIMNKRNLFFFFVVLLFLIGNFGSCDLGGKSIEYAFQNSFGDVVTVEVPKGEKSNSTFSEIGGAWYVHLEGLDPILLNVEGTITGYVWTFTNLTATGPNVTITGKGGGTADAPHPDGTYITGTIEFTVQYTGGSPQVGYDTWTGFRTK
jgi:hypothetical protein